MSAIRVVCMNIRYTEPIEQFTGHGSDPEDAGASLRAVQQAIRMVN